MNANGISATLTREITATQALLLPDTASPYLDTCKAVKEENQPSLEPKGNH